MWIGSLGLILKQLISVRVCPGIIASGTMPKKPSGFTAVWEIEMLPPPPPVQVPAHPQTPHAAFSHFPLIWKKNFYFHWCPLSSLHHFTYSFLHFSQLLPLHAIPLLFHSHHKPLLSEVNQITLLCAKFTILGKHQEHKVTANFFFLMCEDDAILCFYNFTLSV